jgi:hypothetical protein
VHDQQHHDRAVPKDRAHLQVLEAAAQALLQVQPLKKGLKDNEPGKGRQLLILESNLRQRGLSSGRQTCYASSRRLLLWCDCCVATQSYQS